MTDCDDRVLRAVTIEREEIGREMDALRSENATLREQVAACTQGSDLGYTRLENVGLRKDSVVQLNLIKGLTTRAEKAEADNVALRKDAERYRWLRDTHKQGAKNPHGEGIVVVTDRPSKEPRYIGPLGWELLDTAIDAAMGKGE